jgi:hypothetical protein
MQVAVDDETDVGGGEPDLTKGLIDRDASWPIPSFDLWAGLPQPGVQQQRAPWSLGDVAEHRLNAWVPAVGLFCRANKGAQRQASDVVDSHVLTLGAGHG